MGRPHYYSRMAVSTDNENETAAEDEVKPQLLKDAHLAAMASLLATR